MQYKITRANAKTLEDWCKLYTEKTGDEVDIPEGFQIYYLPHRGFSLMKADFEGGILMVYHLCGDIKFWYDVAELLCQQNPQLRCISTICTRNIDAYCRLWHWEIVKKEEINGEKRYVCKDDLGRKVIITHCGYIRDTRKSKYFVTKYLYERLVE